MDITPGEVWAVIVTTVLGGIIKALFELLKHQKEKYDTEKEEQQKLILTLKKNNDELLKWKNEMMIKHLEVEQSLDNITSIINNIIHSNTLLLKSRIMLTCKEILKEGKIELEDKEALTELFASYKTMGGSGVSNILYEQTMKLPISELDTGGESNNVKVSKNKSSKTKM